MRTVTDWTIDTCGDTSSGNRNVGVTMIGEEAAREMAKKVPVDSKGTVAVQVGVGGEGLRSALFCVLLLLSILGESSAAFEGEVGLRGTWTDNLYLTESSVEDFVTMPFGYVETGLGEHFGLRYGLNGYLYGTNSELNALWQRAAARYGTKVGGKHDLEAELGYGGILHVSDTKNLDHHQFGGIVDLNLHPSPRMLIVPGIEGYWRTYPNTENLDYVEGIGNLLMNRSFATRTTLRLSGTLYFKRFLESIPEDLETDDTLSQAASNLLSAGFVSTLGNGSGPGAGGPGMGPGQPGGGAGAGRGPGPQGPPPGATIQGNEESQSAGQLLLAARLAQSLGSRAGIFVEGTYRTNFLDPPRFEEGSIPGVDREFFDDHYGYEGPGALMQLSVLLPLSMRMVLTALIEERRFVGREALDMDGNPKDPSGEDRRDERYEVAVRGEFFRDFERAFPEGITAEVGYVHVWNESNDDWYDTEENRVFASASLLW
jgi:hypothetical protein